MTVRLSHRLLAIADMVPKGPVLIDVGCDHANLDIYLCRRGIVDSCLGLDVAEAPLKKARQNVKNAGLENSISLIMSDGFEGISPVYGATIVIAGMGGILMERILSRGRDHLEAADRVILSPHSDVDRVRAYMSGLYGICLEDMVCEDGKYYPVICYDTSLTPDALSHRERLYGPVLIAQKHPILLAFLNNRLSVLSGILRDLDSSDSAGAVNRLQQIREEMKDIQDLTDVLKY